MAPCNPPLNFVDNGAAGSAFPPPMDPGDAPHGDNSPTFESSACSLLGQDLCAGMDPISAIDELDGLTSLIDGLTTAADSQLDVILLELDQLGQDKVNMAFDDFAGAEPGATSLLGDVSGITVPALGQVPMVLPNGQATITFGGPPETGGVARAGAGPDTSHLPVVPAIAGTHQVRALNLVGTNPPFVGVETGLGPMVVETLANGQRWWVALVRINPAHAGQFTATLYYAADVTITGIAGTVQRTLPFEVVINA